MFFPKTGVDGSIVYSFALMHTNDGHALGQFTLFSHFPSCEFSHV